MVQKYENKNNNLNITIDEHLMHKKVNRSISNDGKLTKNYSNYGLGANPLVKNVKNKILKSRLKRYNDLNDNPQDIYDVFIN